MKEQVYISGQLGRAIFGDGEKHYVAAAENPGRPVECRPQDLSAFFRYGAEFTMLSDVNTDRVADEVAFRTKAYRALSLVISGLDDELDNDTRSLAIEASAELLHHKPVYNFVRARLLARLTPDGADLEGARLLAEYKKSNVVKSLYEDMLDAREAIPAFLESWRETALEHFASRGEQEAVESLLIEAGFFSDAALAISHGDYNRLNSHIVTHGLNPVLKERFPQVTHVLNAVRSALVEKEAFKEEKAPGAEREETAGKRSQKKSRGPGLLGGLRNAFRKGREEKGAKRFRATEAKKRVDHQIAAIEKQIRRGNLDRAESYLHDLIRFQIAHSEREHLAMSLCSLTNTAIDAHALGLAKTMLDYAFSLGLNDVVIWNTKAELLKALGNLPGALVSYNEAVDLFPRDAVARNGRAEVLKGMGQLDEALEAYEEAARLFPQDVFAYTGRAEVLKGMGRLDEALEAYEETARLFPQDAVVRNGRAEVLKGMGQLDEALEAYEEAARLFPQDVFAYTGRAEVLKGMGRLANALTAYEETARLFPENIVARSGRAEVLKGMGRLDEALEAYEETARLFPQDAVVRNGRAEVLKGMGRLDEALEAYEETARLFPQDAVARSGRAEVLKGMGRLDEALEAYEETARLFPQDAVARNGRAEVLKGMGRLANALTAYEETARLFPENIVARSGRAEVLKGMGRLANALTAYEETARLFPENIVARSGRAEVLKGMGRLDEALEAYEETARLFPQDAVVRNGRANILILLDRIDEARALLTVEPPASYQDWIGYHVVAMSYLKTKEFDEAIRRLTYGLNNNPWASSQNYFATALGVAWIRKRQFAEAEEVLKTNLVRLDIFERQKRLALLGHIQAERGNLAEASASLATIGPTANTHINTLREGVILRFNLPPETGRRVSPTEAAALDERIAEEEFYLAMAA